MSSPALLRLAALVFAAVSLVVVGDTAGKLLTSGGVDPFVVAWSRFALAALAFLPFSGLQRAELHALGDGRIVLRGVFIAGGITCILTALRSEPIANVFGAFFIGPVVSYGLALLVLRETPSPSRAVLLGLGFFGVMLVVKPGFGATTGILFALGAGVFYGCYLAVTRSVAGRYRPRFLLLSQLVVGAVVLAPFGLRAPMPDPDVGLALLIGISAFGSAAGNYLLVRANRIGEATLIAPLVYSQLVSATVLGVVVFGDWPDAVALTGLAIIAASGFGSLWVYRRQSAGTG
ncbi:MAG: DMT family transporter [Rhodobacteraceae bacterium]|nr:DMT family transporter [Paracoccaceae bacterium]